MRTEPVAPGEQKRPQVREHGRGQHQRLAAGPAQRARRDQQPRYAAQREGRSGVAQPVVEIGRLGQYGER
jgi:hypothetical protein